MGIGEGEMKFAMLLVLLRRLVVGWGLCLAVVGGVSCGVRPVEPPVVRGPFPKVIPEGRGTGYVRTVQTGVDGFAMQTGSRLFRRAGSPDVDLVGVAHIGEAGYYDVVQRRLGLADLVLFEGVTDGTKVEPLELDAEYLAREQGKSGYARLARSMGLVSQAERIRYLPKERFRRCDLTIQEMIGLLDQDIAKGGDVAEGAREAKREIESIQQVLGGRSWLMNSVLGLVSMSHPIRARLRLGLVGLGGETGEGGAASPRLRRLILEDRNRKVISELGKVLREEGGKRRVAVFYGAGHHAGLERDLRRMGYVPVGGIAWADAVTSRPYADGISAEEVRETLYGDSGDSGD